MGFLQEVGSEANETPEEWLILGARGPAGSEQINERPETKGKDSIVKGKRNAAAMLTVASGIALAVGAQAQGLGFAGGYVTNLNSAALYLTGPTNMVCVIDRLGATNGTWSSVGTVTLNCRGASKTGQV